MRPHSRYPCLAQVKQLTCATDHAFQTQQETPHLIECRECIAQYARLALGSDPTPSVCNGTVF